MCIVCRDWLKTFRIYASFSWGYLYCQLTSSRIFSSGINISADIITITINCPVLTHKIITLSIMQHSANCKEDCVLEGLWVWDWTQKREASLVWGGQNECGAQPCLDPGESEMWEGMVGDKSTSANSMGHFSTGEALTLSNVCLPVMTERDGETETLNKRKLDEDS